MKLELQVVGMSCAHCEARVIKTLLAIQGVNQVQASASTQRVHVDFDEFLVSRGMLERALERLGYQVVHV